MRISYQHANPTGGNESVLLRFDTGGEQSCVLVDAGARVELDRLLGPDDDLAAILVTHAHLDHYQSLGDCHREGVPVYTSPATAAAFDDVLDVAAAEYDVETAAATVDAITGIDGWTQLTDHVRVHPVPAGHAPGAVGYLFEAEGDQGPVRLLVPGDFTRRDAGGFPAFDPGALVDVDVLFLPVATWEGYEERLSTALGTALQRAHAGSPTLVTTSGLTGVQFGVCCAETARRLDLSVPVRLVGQVAKLYDAMGYEDDDIALVPRFEDQRDCIAHGTITIAGPEVPRERSSGRIFGYLQDQPDACVVQVLGSGEAPLDEGRCTIHDYKLINHPEPATLEAVHDELDPTHTVIIHQHGGRKGAYNHLKSCVWSPNDADEYTLYRDGNWVTPPWMGRGIERDGDTDRRAGQFFDDELLDSVAPPAIGRRETVDPAAEGIDLDRVRETLRQYEAPSRATESAGRPAADGTATADPATAADTAVDQSPEPTDASDGAGDDGDGAPPETGAATADGDDGPAAADAVETEATGPGTEQGEAEATATQPTTAPMATDDADTTDGADSAGNGTSELYRTTGTGGDGLDPRIAAAIEAGDLSKAEVLEAYREAQRKDQPTDEDGSPDDQAPSGAAESTEPAAAGETAEDEGEQGASTADGEARAVGDGAGDATSATAGAGSDETTETGGTPTAANAGTSVDTTPDRSESTAEPGSSEAPSAAETDAASESENEPDTDDRATPAGSGEESGTGTETPERARGTSSAPEEDDGRPVTLDQLTVALAQHAVDGSEASTGALVREAIDAYLEALLEGTAVPTAAPVPNFQVDTSAPLREALEAAVARDPAFEDLDALLAASLAEQLGDGDATVVVPGLESRESLLTAVAAHDDREVDSLDAVVTCAVRWYLGE